MDPVEDKEGLLPLLLRDNGVRWAFSFARWLTVALIEVWRLVLLSPAVCPSLGLGAGASVGVASCGKGLPLPSYGDVVACL
jgi:hypothetical protein